MILNDIGKTLPYWIENSGNDSDIIISSRSRLARNIKGFFYAHRADPERLVDIVYKVTEAANDVGFGKENFMSSDMLDENLISLLEERNLISKDLFKKPGKRGIIVKDMELNSIMINEEDHLRIQSLKPGYDIDGTLSSVMDIEKKLSEKLDFSYSEKYGYLTACPTNMGTGLRTSVFMHLPCMVMSGELQKVFRSGSHLGIAVRGYRGEGSDALGNLFQISNQSSLGKDEKLINRNLSETIARIIEYERNLANLLYENTPYKIEDKVWRSIGILKTARMLSSKEFMTYISDLKLGIRLGIIKKIELNELNKLMIQIQPEHLQAISEKKMDYTERDFFRAGTVRKRFIDLSI